MEGAIFIDRGNDLLISFSIECLIVYFGLPTGLGFEQETEISLEGILDLGSLIILPRKINLLLAIKDSIFLILLKFFRTEILVIFLSITPDHLIFKILRKHLMRKTSIFLIDSFVVAHDSHP